MSIRSMSFIAASLAIASAASATVTEVTTLINRQVSARGRSGSTSSPVFNADTNSTLLMGVFNDSRSAISPDASASAHANQNTSISNGFYFGTIHADAAAAGSTTGYSEASSIYGSPSNQTLFSLAFTVDVPTTGHIFGSVSVTKTGTSTTSPALFLVGDFLLPSTSQPPLLIVQPTQATSPMNFDQMFTFLPGHRYSITASVNLTAGGAFSGAGSGSGDINFTAEIPAPASAALLGVAGLGAMRRRRR